MLDNITTQRYCCVVIPALINVAANAPWAVLPPGIHDATLSEVESAFATTPHRQWLFEGFQRVADALQVAGCTVVYLDGSFTTGKPHPEDYDGCWDHTGIDFTKLDPVLLDFSNKRAAQKRKFLGEMFPALSLNGPGGTFLDFFQIEKFSAQPKGIIRILLAPKGPIL
ncbi:DUF6932 family protein [Sphingomonas sp. Leaf4]|uniref:DUF6932 family protein n=1 Tax=Sphingomonas sp. Leaf4 TaxID=2876553 RepID=UPI001E651F73|nr:hypothetical protein [Sphingomonas sp. Leaf4]